MLDLRVKFLINQLRSFAFTHYVINQYGKSPSSTVKAIFVVFLALQPIVVVFSQPGNGL